VFEKKSFRMRRVGKIVGYSASALFVLAFVLLIFFLCYAHRVPRQELLDQFDPWIDDLDRAVRKEAKSRPEDLHLVKQPGVKR
jgi:hypothetical protein